MIPKIIHYVWLSGDPFPDKIQNCINSWHRKLPDYTIQVWNADNFDLKSVLWVRQAYKNKNYEMATDYIRFYVLYHYGGIYLDADVEVTQSFNDLLKNKYFFGFEYTGMPEAAVIGAEKGLSWIRNCYEWYEKHVLYDEKGIHRVICPLVVWKGFESWYHQPLMDDHHIHSVDGGRIYPYFYFSPKNGFSGKIIRNRNSYCIHHFNSAWLDKSYSSYFRSRVHLGMIKMLGKVNYNRILYKVRKKLYRT